MAFLQIPLDIPRETTFEDFSITDPHEREKYFGQFDHVRIYGRDYLDRLRSAVFSVKSVDMLHEYGEKAKFYYGLMKNDNSYICFK